MYRLDRTILRRSQGPIIAVLAIAFLAKPTESSAGGPFDGILERSIVSAEVLVDSVNGNGWRRSDMFTNNSGDQVAHIDAVDILLLNPDDVGFADIFGVPPGETNLFDVLAAAEAAHPDVLSYGLHWHLEEDSPTNMWSLDDPTPPSLPTALNPGESLLLSVDVRNTILGSATRADGVYPDDDTIDPSELGEVLVGFDFSGSVEPVPEPAGCSVLTLVTLIVGLRLSKLRRPRE